ncbi:hypothetical protein [Parabacteroides sp.]
MVKIYKTQELTDELIGKIVDGFNASFALQGAHMTKDSFLFSSKNNDFGYSYHALYMDGETVAGFNTIHPSWYYRNKDRVKMGLSGSTFVLKEYRKNFLAFHDMYKALQEACMKEGMIAFLGVPNENSYKYSIVLLKCKELFSLGYYILPLRLSKILKKKWMLPFDLFSVLGCWIWVLLNNLIAPVFNTEEKIKTYRIDSNNDTLDRRFMAEKYKTITDGCGRFSYTMNDEDGIATAYLMDFRERGRKTFKKLAQSLLYIVLHEKADAILYVGTMNLSQIALFRTPRRFEPKKMRFTVNILKCEDAERYADLQDVNAWDFSLLNLDVR